MAGLAAGIFMQLPIPQTAALAGFTAGMALLPDLDKCGSSPARSLGFVSEAVAWVFGRISGGHRHATHSFLGIAVFTALAWVSCHFRADWAGKAGLALLMTLSVSAALEALHLARGHVADLAGVAVAAAEIWYGYGLRLIPIAVLLGCATHITGDMLTDSGCMLGYPWSQAALPPAAGAAGLHHGHPPGVAGYRPDPVRGAAGPRSVDHRPGVAAGPVGARDPADP